MTAVKHNLNQNLSLIGVEGKHVAMLSRWFSRHGGLELYCHRLVEELLDRQVKVTVVCEENKSDLKHANLEIIDYGPSYKKLSKGDTYRYAFKKTKEILDSLEGVDIVHTHQLPCHKHDVVTFHNHTINRLSNVGLGWEKMVNKAKANFADKYQTKMIFDKRLCTESACRIFVSSIEQMEYYDEFKLDSTAPYVIAYPGSSTNEDTHNQDPEGDSVSEFERVERFPFMFVGKGYRMKGLDVLFKACRLLKSEGIEFELHVVGLDKKPILKASLIRHKIEDRVKFKGFVSDMDSVFKDAYSIVTPSRLESFGMAPLQAMRHGLVPIVSKVCGISETLTNEVDGLIVEDHLDPKDLANQMKRLVLDQDLYSRCSQNAKKKSKEFTWTNTCNATILAYQSVLQSRKRNTLGD